jgi:hypothetical protein
MCLCCCCFFLETIGIVFGTSETIDHGGEENETTMNDESSFVELIDIALPLVEIKGDPEARNHTAKEEQQPEEEPNARLGRGAFREYRSVQIGP